MIFEFATATRIVFGWGTAAGVRKIAAPFGSHAFLVTRGSTVPPVLDTVSTRYTVSGEPTVESIRAASQEARTCRCDHVIAIGGGSAIDAGKAIAALATNSCEPLDYLEVIGKGHPLPNAPLPFIAIPTTAGTGSEVTRNAVLGSPEHGVKASLRSPLMLPRVAIVDPQMTLDAPANVTASTGLDALTQVIEPYVSIRANAMTDMFCLEGIHRIVRSLERACTDGSNQDARTDMSWASLLGGLALANAGLGIVHGFAAPVGGMFDAPHGAICAALLPFGMRANIRALQSRDPNGKALKRYAGVAAMLCGAPDATPEDGAAWVGQLCLRLGIPPLKTYGIDETHLDVLVEKAARASSTKGNPVELYDAELRSVIEPAITFR
jgi:alcohol dehydrogenase class IV